MLEKFRKLDPAIHLIFAFAIVFLGYKYISLENSIPSLIKTINTPTPTVTPTASPSASPQTPAPSSTPTLQTTTTKTSSKQVSYIPLGSTSEINTSEWSTLEDTAVSLDLISDYGQNATVSWEASLKVANPGEKAQARLWDDTNKIAVNESELSTTSTEFVHQSTKDLNLWSGRNVYKVQVRSLIDGYKVTYSNGKIKIQY